MNYTLLEIQNDVLSVCERVIDRTKMGKSEIERILKSAVDHNPDLKEFCEKYNPFSMAKTIYALKTHNEVLDYQKGFGDLMVTVKEIKNSRELAEKQKEADKKLEGWKNLIDEQKRQKEELQDIANDSERRKERDRKIIEEINKNKGNDQSKNYSGGGSSSFDEESKKKYIEETERDLKKHKISDQQLSKELGFDDWKAEINKSSGWSSAQTFRFSIQDVIKKLSSEIICDYCKETKSPYPASSYEIPSKKKKFCSLDCQDAWKKENGDENNTPNVNNRVIFQKSFVNEFFAWMKKNEVERIEFDFNANQVIIKCKDNKQLSLTNSGLSSNLQQELTRELKSTSEPITFEQVSSEYNKSKNDKNAGIIGFLLIVGLVLIVSVGVLVVRNRNKKRGY